MIAEIAFTETITFWSTLISAPLIYFGSGLVSGATGWFKEASAITAKSFISKVVMAPIQEVFEEITIKDLSSRLGINQNLLTHLIQEVITKGELSAKIRGDSLIFTKKEESPADTMHEKLDFIMYSTPNFKKNLIKLDFLISQARKIIKKKLLEGIPLKEKEERLINSLKELIRISKITKGARDIGSTLSAYQLKIIRRVNQWFDQHPEVAYFLNLTRTSIDYLKNIYDILGLLIV